MLNETKGGKRSFLFVILIIIVFLSTTIFSLTIMRDSSSFSYGLQDDGRFCNYDGLCYLNQTDGYFNIYQGETLLRRFGFGITSNLVNRTVADFSWDWSFNETTDEMVAIYNSTAFTWEQQFDFRWLENMKITHIVENRFQDLTGVKLWYIFTINEGEFALYDGKRFSLDRDRHLQGNLNNITAKIQFPTATFDFSDVLEDYVVTDLYVGPADFFDRPQRILGVGIATQEGGSDFDFGRTVTIDPTITINDVEAFTSLKVNVTTEASPFSHLSIDDNSILLYMPFDVDTPTTTVYDYSSNNNNGIEKNSPVYEREGYIGGAYNFTNPKQAIELPQSLVEGLSEITVAMWLKFNQSFAPGSEFIFEQSGTGDDTVVLLRLGNEKISFSVKNDSQANGQATSDLATNDTNWHHVVGTYNGSQVRIYIDGINADSTPPSLSGVIETVAGSSNKLNIGGNNLGWNGVVDEIFVLNRSLSASEISDLFNNQTARFFGTGTQDFRVKSLEQNGSLESLDVEVDLNEKTFTNEFIQVKIQTANETDYNSYKIPRKDSLVSWFRFNNATGENLTLVHNFVTGENATCSACPTFTTQGYFHGAFLYGADENFTSDGDILDFSSTKEISVFAWVNITNVSGGYRIIASQTGNSNSIADWQLKIIEGGNEDPQVSFSIDDNSGLLFEQISVFSLGEWTFVGGTYNASAGILKNWINAVADAAGSGTEVFDTSQTAPIIIGTNNIGTANMSGLIDSLMIWNTTLNSTQVEKLYNDGPFSYKETSFTNFSGNVSSDHSFERSDDYVKVIFNFLSDANRFYSPLIIGNILLKTIIATTPPDVTIVFPSNVTLGSSDLPVNFNVSLNFEGQTVLYSLTLGETNFTMSSQDGFDFNASNASIADGSYLLNIYANDTLGNRNDTVNVAFSFDTISPDLVVVSPIDGFATSIFDVLFNITVTDVTSIQTRTYSIDSGANVSFDGDEEVRNVVGLHTVTFCANDSVGNLNCSTTIDYNVFEAEGTTGGIGGGGVVINVLNHTEIIREEIIFHNKKFPIIVNTFDKNDNPIDIQNIFISINGSDLKNVTLEANVIDRLDLGIYEREFKIIESDIPKIHFNIRVEQGTKVIEEAIVVELEQLPFVEGILETVKETTIDFLVKAKNLIVKYKFYLGGLIIGIIFIYVMLLNIRKDKKDYVTTL